MSVEREVKVKYGDRHFKFVRTERVYEITDGEEKLIRKGGDYILNLAGHTAGSWETYQLSPNSFNTLDYQKRFREEYNYSFPAEESRVEAGQAAQTKTEHQSESVHNEIRSSEPAPEIRGDGEETVDVEAMEVSMARIEEIQAEMATNPAPERMVELVRQLGEESEKMQAAWDGDEPVEIVEEPETVVIPAEADTTQITELPPDSRPVYRRRSWFERSWDRIRRRPDREYEDTGVFALPEGGRVVRVDEEFVAVERGDNTAAAAIGGVALGGLISFGVWGVHELLEHKYMGHSPTGELRRNGLLPPYGRFDHDHFRHWNGLDQDDFFGRGHKFGEFCRTHILRHHPKPLNIRPDEIHAKTDNQFQQGIVGLLRRQGLQVQGVTYERLSQMNSWMRGHQIASGMRLGSHGLTQNLTGFPKQGHEFVNAHASAEQGFPAGRNGNGGRALLNWIRHARQIGINISRP